MVLTATYIVGNIFVFISTIPWFSFGLTRMDSQPFAVISALLFLGVCLVDRRLNLKFPLAYYLLAGVLAIGVTLGLLYSIEIDFILVRGFINYSGIIIFILAFHEYLKRYRFPLSVLMLSNVIWLFFGIIQLFVPDILSDFVVMRTSAGRGVTSLAPEPTFFAIYLFFSSWLCLISVNYKPNHRLKVLLAFNLFGIVFLAKSMMVMLFIVLASSFYFAQQISFRKIKNAKKTFIFIILLLFSYIVIMHYMPTTRIGRLTSLILSVNFIDFIFMDASVNHRFADVILPLHGFIVNWGIPGGFHSFTEVADMIIGGYGDYFWRGYGGLRIMSWNGALLYELGIFGVFLWVLLTKKLLNGTKRRRFELFLLFLLLFSAIPLAFPLIPMIFASFYFQKYYGSAKRIAIKRLDVR